MANRDRAAEILEVKRRGQRDALSVHYDLKSLRDHWHVFSEPGSQVAGFFPVRAVTLLEVFTRAWIATIVDYGSPYVERAVAFTKNVKLDYELVRAIQGRTITLGDTIAHSISLNSFSQLAASFETLIERPFVPLISLAIDRWAVESRKESPKPIITDSTAMCAAIERLFEVRHILCHEYPRERVFRPEEISRLLDAASEFTAATTEACTELLYGKVPLSNAEMKEVAHEKWQETEAELNRIIPAIKANGDEEACRILDEGQQCWLSYRERQCALRADLARGGTLSGLLWLREAKDVTDARVKELRWYLERKEGEV